MNTALAFDDVLLVPRFSDIPSRDEVSLRTRIFVGLELSLPILSANMASVSGEEMVLALANAGGLGVLDRTTIPPHVAADICVDASKVGNLVVASIGSTGDEGDYLLNSGIKHLCIDVAHGHHAAVAKTARNLLTSHYSPHLIVGNIATAQAAGYLYDEITGGDEELVGRLALKIGVGSGSLCSTRIRTGFGVPTFQSVLDISREMEGSGIHLIADGGIKNSGDIVKCLAAGADAVMLGSLLAGTREAPGDIVKDDRSGEKYKVYRGSASFGIKEKHKGSVSYVEGAEALVPYKGSVVPILTSLAEGIRSGLSYNGSKTIFDMQVSHEFIRVSPAGAVESRPHLL